MPPRKNNGALPDANRVSKGLNRTPRKTEGGPRSLAERRQSAPSLSFESLSSFETEETHEQAFLASTGERSEAHATWGRTERGPILSIKKKSKGGRFQNHFTGTSSISNLFDNSGRKEPAIFIPNSPDNSRLLAVPLEIREKMYGFLLTDTKPIMVGPDWATVTGHVLRYNSIQYACKQIGEEATKFLYKNNVFLAVLQNPKKASSGEEKVFIDSKFLSLFRHVVINCPKANWSLEWHERAATSVEKLVEAGATLVTLTLVVSPSRGTGTSSTSIGLEANPIRFADFFHFSGPLMRAIVQLKCKVLNIVIKKSTQVSMGGVLFTSGMKRLLISVNLSYLHSGQDESAIANAETLVIAREKREAAQMELQSLKERFELIFEDYEKAIKDGLCREMQDDELVTDGMALATIK